ncbi:phosphonate transport system substrate-binding protein [Tistlia consotensis]|uniref:Phosphonate transport system substrate-binding protein n=1 Tax=Tistlia consotensis USBA 355 TaxID=560819 RepID=A0A1Y6CNX2_9PROT|nr:phosphate/phosphite/phosphonate ABC transporter substrate-binding protein [Tistlia consotensis]SMF77614.1 phosphonate transport system substrate-binding protein [Tistlia consotensis USBA 355]SNS21038.1 phosphonate transport system substrate-binding protein [Tistlia consotensis]
MTRSVITMLGCAAVLAAGVAGTHPAAAAAAGDCPNDGVVRFGVEPYEAAAHLLPVYEDLGKLLARKLGCEVRIYIGTSYNAEIEAMRNGKLELGQFGPLGYVLAHQVAKAEAVATFSNEKGEPEHYFAGIVTWPGSGIEKIEQVKGQSFAFSDPASTSGHLFPAYALRKNGIDPDSGVKAIYAGSHTASYEALRNHKVKAGELNSEQITSAKNAGIYKQDDFVQLWESQPIPEDPICVRGDLPEGFKKRLTGVLQNLDLSELPAKDLKVLIGSGKKLVPQTDAAYDQIRDLVDTLHVDLAKL